MPRKKIGLIFSYDEHWIGGTYYIINLVNALNQLEDYQKPHLIIFAKNKDFEIIEKQTKYPYLILELLTENPSEKYKIIVNKFSNRLLGVKCFKRRYTKSIDAIFPFRENNYLKTISKDKRIYWIPDFQEKHFPEFYNDQHLTNEKIRNNDIVTHSRKLLLSSFSALEDLKKYYPEFNTKPYVVHFAVKIPDLSGPNQLDVLSKYDLPPIYFFAPNQFWQHKNHLLVIKAVQKLKSEGREVIVAFSGKEHDYRSPGYTEILKTFVKENSLQHNVRFLGFLDREDQLKLMEFAFAIIQPSLFEGWSTVIEEAMAMNKLVLASDLSVNIEQLGEKGVFFNRSDHYELADKMLQVLLNPIKVEYDYRQKQIDFAIDFLNCVNDQP